MNFKQTLRNFIGVVFSNLSTIIAGVVVGFVIPKLMSVHDYGLLKTFTLYVSYLGLFSFGIIDGIVLEYGGKDFHELDKPLFRSYFKWYLLVNTISAIFIVLLCLFFFSNDHKFIFISIAFNLVAVNISGYFQQISQITQRFKEYSLRKIIQSLLNIFLVLFCIIFYKITNTIDYKLYVSLLVVINFLLSIWYLNTYKELVFGDSISMKNSKSDIKYLITIGIPLLIANICSVLIVTLDSQFVNILFPTREYAIYAFAYNLLSLITIATAAISTILYPILKRTDETSMKSNYGFLISVIVILIFATLNLYFPLFIFVKWYLPNYLSSLYIFRIIFPGVVFTTPIVVVMHNYYKALKDSNSYFKKSLVVILFSVIANIIAYSLFKSTVAISYASVIVLLIWYIYVEEKFVKLYDYKRSKNLSYIFLIISSFYISSHVENIYLGFLIYLFIYIVITYMYFKELIQKIYVKFKKGKK
ncbi:oligosaccharide flippase family protein [Streptococcus uberis]|uniref:oligosaccharide flippase family protein n=1 Tax=Streptococcus uberis TaxID=1349 RepID=UPI0038929216